MPVPEMPMRELGEKLRTLTLQLASLHFSNHKIKFDRDLSQQRNE